MKTKHYEFLTMKWYQQLRKPWDRRGKELRLITVMEKTERRQKYSLQPKKVQTKEIETVETVVPKRSPKKPVPH